MFPGRAGGGHSFSGGGHSSSGGHISSGGGGGSHFLFVGGGGGSGGGGVAFLVIGIIVLMILLAVFIVNRRARRALPAGVTPAPYPHSDVPAMAARPEPSGASADDGLSAIKAHDPDFNFDAFKSSVERSFFVVEEAWSERKPDMSRQVMADGLWHQHKAQIDNYVANGTRNVMDGLAIGRVDLMHASSDAQYDQITVRILAACADYDINVDSGKVVRGNKHDMENWQEDWMFQRSSKATTKVDGGTMQQKCPNCGAPLDVDLAGVCKYCRAPVMSGDFDWVLARIDQVN